MDPHVFDISLVYNHPSTSLAIGASSYPLGYAPLSTSVAPVGALLAGPSDEMAPKSHKDRKSRPLSPRSWRVFPNSEIMGE